MDPKEKFVLWCLRQRGDTLPSDIDWLAVRHRTPIGAHEIQPLLGQLVKLGLARLVGRKVEHSRFRLFVFVITSAGKKEVIKLPKDPLEIFSKPISSA